MDALRDVGLGHLPVVGLAKAKGEKEERIYAPGHREPLILSPASHVSRLVQRIRDEAHRFAIAYHRKLRSQAFVMPLSKSGKTRR